MHFTGEEFEQRWERARAGMEQDGLDAILVSDKYNYWYFTGHLTREIERKRPMFFLLPKTGTPTLIIYQLGVRKARETVPNAEFRTYEDLPFPVELVVDALKDAGLASQRIGMELGADERLGFSYQEFQQLTEALPALKPVDASQLFQRIRMIKSRAEIAAIKKACDLSLEAWTASVGQLRPGLRDGDIKKIIATEMARAGSDFDVAGHISVGDGVAGVGGYREGEVLWADFGGTYCGYQADIARRISFGPPTKAQRTAQEQISMVFDRGIAAIKPGARCSDVARACNDALESVGLPRLNPRKRVGHGLGLGSGEPPSLNELDDTVLQPGMVITPEPRFTLPTGEKIHIEEVVVVAEGGYERLTYGAQELQVYS